MSRQTMKFRVFRGTSPAELIAAQSDVIKIGRLPNSDIRLDGDEVARAHAVLERDGDVLRLIDLGSAAGTCLNGQLIQTAIVKDGDVMTIGTHRVEVQLGTNPAGAARPQLDTREFEDHNGARVAEVVAMYGDTVIDVQHLGQTRDRRRQAPAWLAAGGALALAGFALFAHDATRDWDGYAGEVQAAQEAGVQAPEKPGTGLGGLGFGLAMLGLIPIGLGAARMQDRARRSYTLGEGHDAALHVPVAGASEFPLVRGDGEHTLQFTADMTGEVVIDGRQVPLAELAATGLAERGEGGTYSLPLAAGASARVRYQGLTFHIHSVAPGVVTARRGEIDKPFWFHNGLSAAAIGSLLLLTQMVPNEAGALTVQEDLADSRFVGYLAQPNEAAELEDQKTLEEEVEKAGGVSGERHKGDEGKAGKPNTKEANKRYAIQGVASAIPKLSRNFSAEAEARTTGILGLMQAESGHFMASPYGGAFAVGNDDRDAWGNLTGGEIGEANGTMGLGLAGTARFGGGTGEGTVGLSSVGLIGHNRDGDGDGLTRSVAFAGKREPRTPQPRIGVADIQGGLDKDLIRRVVRAHINEVRHCYNQGLAKDQNLKGRVAVQFSIGATGKVSTSVVSENDLKDGSVGACIAQAVRRWQFPKAVSGGSTLVTYPFILQAG